MLIQHFFFNFLKKLLLEQAKEKERSLAISEIREARMVVRQND